jgi:two-component system response regulator YesN
MFAGAIGQALSNQYNNGAAVIGVICMEQSTLDDVVEACKQIQFYTQRFFHFTVTAAVGTCADTLKELRASGIRACEALDRKVCTGKNQVILAGDMPEDAGNGTVLLARADEDALKEAVAMNKSLDVQKKLDEIFETYFSSGAYTRKAVRQFGVVLLLPALRALSDDQITLKEAFGQNSHIVDEIECYETLDEIRMFVKNVYSRAMRALEERRGSNYRHTVRDSIEYVQAHYAESIQVSDVAAAVYVTPNYFSKIFKQETGENFTEWLNKFRIEKAKALILQQPGDKVYEIAAKVGFNDYKYFAFIFKKYTGYTPGTFKELNH